MIIGYKYGYPNKWTFKIKPITELLTRYVGDGKGWLDPFSGMNSPAEFTNDLNPDMPTTYHIHALDFCGLFQECDGGLFDPPYSSTQVKECYNSIGFTPDTPQNDYLLAFDRVKDSLAHLIISGGHCISFGWSSNGLGKKRGFEKVEILLVQHGGHHNDTIVTVERKVQASFGAMKQKAILSYNYALRG